MMTSWTFSHSVSFSEHSNFTTRIGDHAVHNEITKQLTVYRNNSIVANFGPVNTAALVSMEGLNWVSRVAAPEETVSADAPKPLVTSTPDVQVSVQVELDAEGIDLAPESESDEDYDGDEEDGDDSEDLVEEPDATEQVDTPGEPKKVIQRRKKNKKRGRKPGSKPAAPSE